MRYRYIVTMIVLLVFSVPISFANGGPDFKQLYKGTVQNKSAVELIDQSAKKIKQKFCLVNVGQNKVEKKPC